MTKMKKLFAACAVTVGVLVSTAAPAGAWHNCPPRCPLAVQVEVLQPADPTSGAPASLLELGIAVGGLGATSIRVPITDYPSR